jgi:hypothetical protein
MRSEERTGSTYSFHLKRWNKIETIRMAEITSALLRPVGTVRLTPCFASHWEAPHEIRICEWQDALPAVFLRAMLRADWCELLKGNWNRALLLRSRLLRFSLPERYPAFGPPGKGILKTRPMPEPARAVSLIQREVADSPIAADGKYCSTISEFFDRPLQP